MVFYYADNGHLDIINFDLFAFFDSLLVHTLSDFLFDLSNSGIVAVLERYSDIYDGLAEVKRVVADAEHRLLSWLARDRYTENIIGVKRDRDMATERAINARFQLSIE